MDAPSRPENDQILALIGAIVLVSQDAERYLKLALPFVGADDPALGAALKRAEKLKRRTLGELTGKLVEASASDSLDFAGHMAHLIDARNRVVHHFNETYGAQIAAGAHQEVVASLQELLTNLRSYRNVSEQLALAVLEGLRDVTYRDTPEQSQLAELCASIRARVAS